jgi:hypothetical protein
MLKERFKKTLKENSQISDEVISLLADKLVEDTTKFFWDSLVEKTVEKTVTEAALEVNRPDD